MTLFLELRLFFQIKDSVKLLLSMFLYGIAQAMISPMNAIYLQDSIHLTKFQISLIFSITLLANMGLTAGLGYLSDHIRKKKWLAATAAAIAVIGFFCYGKITLYNGSTRYC